jgi:hypothetical protein
MVWRIGADDGNLRYALGGIGRTFCGMTEQNLQNSGFLMTQPPAKPL